MHVADGVEGGPWKGRALLRKKYPSAFPLSKAQLDILEALAKNAPINPNKLSKEIEKAYSFVYETLREFERRKIVDLQWVTSEKQVATRHYDLDLEGVLLVLYRWMRNPKVEEQNRSSIIKTIERHGSKLPLVFGKWRLFRKAGVEKVAMVRLKIMVDAHRHRPFRLGIGYYPWLQMEQQLTRFFFLWDLYRGDDTFIEGFDLKHWMTALRCDKETRAFIIHELADEQARLEKLQDITKKVLSFMKS
jgi:DNA-binding Lrp family transcriptional regulator